MSGPPQMKEPEEVNRDTEEEVRTDRYDPLALDKSHTLNSTKPAIEASDSTK
jgi:hypothetical protein